MSQSRRWWVVAAFAVMALVAWVARRDGVEVVCNTRTWPPRPGTRLEPMRSRLRVTLADGRIEEQETRWEVRSYTAAQLRLASRDEAAAIPLWRREGWLEE